MYFKFRQIQNKLYLKSFIEFKRKLLKKFYLVILYFAHMFIFAYF